MGRTKKVGSAGRFGVRYGRTTRKKIADIEALYRSRRYKCSNCKKVGVKRVSYGIWQCDKCNIKFAGKAYAIE